MTDRPCPSPQPAPPQVTVNQYGWVSFSTDRGDLIGHYVQVVYRSDRTVELWEPSQPPRKVYAISDAAVSYEQGQRAIKKTPTWAIVLAIIGFFVFLLGLLFLLVKETTYVPTNTVRFTDPHGRTLVVTL